MPEEKEKEENLSLNNKKETNEEESSSSSERSISHPDAKGYMDSYSRSEYGKSTDDSETTNYRRPMSDSFKNYASDRYSKAKQDDEDEEVDEIDPVENLASSAIGAAAAGAKSKFNKGEGELVSDTFFSKYKKYIIIGGIATALFIFLILLPILLIFSKDPSKGLGDAEDENAEIVELKAKIDEVKSEISSEYGVSIDSNLILAALVAYQTNDNLDIEKQDETETIETTDSEGNSTTKEVSVMYKYIRLLAQYQIMTTTGGSCKSDTIRDIASNDSITGEKNYKCDSSASGERREKSIERGNYDDDNSGGVFYWNLIDGDFIPDYYADFINENETEEYGERDKQIHNITEDIYDYYETMEKEEEGGICSTIDASCPGVTVNGTTYPLEQYVAGVLYAEFHTTIYNEEVGKAAAIAIRSYTLDHTNNCKNTIGSSSYEQNFSSNTSTYTKYAEDTAGIVMTEEGDKIISGVYSLGNIYDCVPVGDKCKYQRCTRFADSVSSCSAKVTEFLVPRGTITYTGRDVHYGGMEPWIAKYLGEQEGYTYEKILKAFYGEDLTLSKLSGSGESSSSTTDLACGDGDYVTSDGVTFVAKNYHVYGGKGDLSDVFDFSAGNVSQCPWYAKYRAIEIVESSSLSNELKEKAKSVLLAANGNGNQWYGGTNSTLSYFQYTNDVTKPKPGSLVSWHRNTHGYGHVAIVEKVNSDGSIVISEGWNRFGADGGNSVNSIAVQTRTMTIDQVRTYGGGGTFIGYTYLLSHKR